MDGSNYIKIFRKTEKKHADLREFYVGYTKDSQYQYTTYVTAYNAAHDDFVAVARYVNKPEGVDTFLISQSDPNYSALANGSFKDLYEFMGRDYFDKEKIIMPLLKANETDGKLYSFSPVWNFDIMTANAALVTADDFSSFEKMLALEKESDEKRIFSEKTRDGVFITLISQLLTEYYDENGEAYIDPAALEKVKEFALLYPTTEEYQASEDYDKAGFRNYFGYYEGGDSPAYDITQFDIGDYRSGRYAASIFTGPTIPVDSDYEDEYFNNIFRNFSSYVNILYKGNFVLPGFWGKGSVKGTPANYHTAAVSSTVNNIDGAKSFINFLLTEYEPGYYYSLSADVLEQQAEIAAGLSRTHERGGKLVRDTIYFSSDDYFEMPDITKAEVMPLLNAIKYGSFPADPITNEYYYYESIFYYAYPAKFLDGELTAEEYARLLEAELR
jgi:ABC-type glycerol-3-phosphate transport system substrate-binding protein